MEEDKLEDKLKGKWVIEVHGKQKETKTQKNPAPQLIIFGLILLFLYLRLSGAM